VHIATIIGVVERGHIASAVLANICSHEDFLRAMRTLALLAGPVVRE
jgi:hypothetical protein